MVELQGISDLLGEVAERVGPSVVGIGDRWAQGSGVIVADHRVLTNAHNVRSDRVTVTFGNGRSEEGRLAGIDVDGDLAVLEVETGEAGPIEWGESADGARIGQAVVGLANPGGRGLRVTLGFVSGTQRSFRGPRGRRITGTIEHTAPLLPGSSGGPVVDTDGRLVGINTNRLGEGFYLALPADGGLRDRVMGLAAGEEPSARRLGVGVAPPEIARRLRRAVGLAEIDGLLVREVLADSPAERAGIQEGDLIVEASGRQVASVDDLHAALDQGEDDLTITVVRGTDRHQVGVAFD